MADSPKDEARNNGSPEMGDVTVTQALREADAAMRAAHREVAQRQGKDPDAPDGDR